MHAAVAIMAADSHVPRFLTGSEDNFWQVIAEINILLFLREGTRTETLPAYVTDGNRRRAVSIVMMLERSQKHALRREHGRTNWLLRHNEQSKHAMDFAWNI